MSVKKVDVSLDEADLEWLREQAERPGESLSAVWAETVRAARRESALDEELWWFDAPELTLEQLEEYRREWDAG